jgi:hypothetical protein
VQIEPSPGLYVPSIFLNSHSARPVKQRLKLGAVQPIDIRRRLLSEAEAGLVGTRLLFLNEKETGQRQFDPPLRS